MKKIIPAIGPDSNIVKDEMVLPNAGVYWWPTAMNLHMYTMLGAMERNMDPWHCLMDLSRLKIS